MDTNDNSERDQPSMLTITTLTADYRDCGCDLERTYKIERGLDGSGLL